MIIVIVIAEITNADIGLLRRKSTPLSTGLIFNSTHALSITG